MSAETPMTPEEDQALKDELKQLFDEADAKVQAEGGEAAEGADMAQEGQMEMEEGKVEEAEATQGVDLAPLMETLGATEERAKTLYEAAQQMQQTQGKTPEELAKMIADDFDILMQLEMVAARGEGGAMGGPAAGEMPPAGPEGMPADPMMPPEGM